MCKEYINTECKVAIYFAPNRAPLTINSINTKLAWNYETNCVNSKHCSCLSVQQRVDGATAGCDASEGRVQFGGWLDNVFEAEGAVAGEPLALAPAAQVLPVGPLWVNVALGFCTGTTRFVARLERKEQISWSRSTKPRVYRTYMTCDVLYAVWVKFFLAFPTELLEVNLEHMYALTSLEYCSHPEFLILQQHWLHQVNREMIVLPCLCPERTKHKHSPIADCILCSGNSHISVPETGGQKKSVSRI